MRAHTHFTRVKAYNVERIYFVALGFVVHTCAIEQSWETRHAPYEQTCHKHKFS